MNSEVQQLIENKLKELMTDDTQIITKPNTQPIDNSTKTTNSQLLSVSVRGWITLLVVFTVCLMSVMKIEIKEPLYTMTGMIIAFYFGQNKSGTTTTQTPATTTTTNII